VDTEIRGIYPAPGWRAVSAWFDEADALHYEFLPVIGWVILRKAKPEEVFDVVELLVMDGCPQTVPELNEGAICSVARAVPPGKKINLDSLKLEIENRRAAFRKKAG
jgi:hypothetical protein